MLEVAPGTAIFGGLGGMSSYFELRRGAVGTMTGFCYPEVLRALRGTLTAGDEDGAYALYSRYLPLIAFEAQPTVGLGIRKELLRRRGVIAEPVTRIGQPPSSQTLTELDLVLATLGLQPDRKPLTL